MFINIHIYFNMNILIMKDIFVFLKNLSITDIIWYDGECSLEADDF